MVGEVTKSAKLETLEVERCDSVGTLAREWEQLAERVSASPFVRPGWFEAWEQAFAKGPVSVLAVRRAGRLVGVMPIFRRRGAVAAPVNWHTPAFAPVAQDEDVLDLLASALIAERGAWVDVSFLDREGPELDALRGEAERAGLRIVQRTIARQPYVDTTGDPDEYEATLPRKQRKELGRLRRRLEEAGALEIEFADGRERLAELLDEGFAIEGSGWKAKRGTAISSQEETDAFYRRVAEWAAEHGWLRLAFLRLEGRALAFDLCLEAAGAAYVLKGGFDPEYRRFGPGAVLTHESLKRAFADPVIRSYEFLGAADEYKLAWTDTVRERERLQAFRRSPLGTLGYLAWTAGRSAAKRVLAATGRG
jgi:CelD/BcsL family acetyltransferase involved in cellulose biosynthesis